MFPFVQATHFYVGHRRPVRLVVIHDMEAAESRTTAENVARWFASGASAPRASAHFCVDQDSIVQCVRGGDTAWHAPGANADGIGIEHAGYARQSRDQWLADDAMLNLSALLSAELVTVLGRFGVTVPLRRLSVAEVADGRTPGFCGHIDVSSAFHRSSHTDPGLHFPWRDYLAKVQWWLPHVGRIDFR